MLYFRLIAVIVFAFILFANQNKLAPSIEGAYCAGSITCHISTDICRDGLGNDCDPSEPGCNCSSVCGPDTLTESCSGFSQGLCSDSSWWITYCNTGCPGSGALYGATCNWQVGACSVDSQCGSCSACCDPGNGPNYCRTDGKTCGGVTISGCGATPTPTPASGCAATAFGTHANCNTWCIDNGAVGCNPDCNGCYYSATSTPTPSPTPSSGGGGSSSCPVQCPPSGACYDACTLCDGAWPDFSNCGGGSSCMENGGTCNDHITGVSTCCSGYCNWGTCESPPTCSGCSFWNGSYCQDSNALCGGGQICSGGTCINPTYSISGNVFIDTNNDGIKQAGEQNYQGATITRTGGISTSTNSSGYYSFSGLNSFVYSLTLTIPSGYQLSSGSTNPRNVTVPPDQGNVNFGIRQAPPACNPTVIIPGAATVNPGQSTTLNVNNCTNVENPNDGVPPPPVTWNPDTGGNSPAPTVNPVNPNPSCAAGVCTSTTTWTAPNCPTSTIDYTPQVTLNGPGGTTNYTTTITVPATYTIGVNVRSVTQASSCLPTDGSAYQSGGAGATVNIVNTSGSYTINQNQVTTTAVPGTSFTCLPSGINYQVSLQPISGYSIIGVNNNGTQTFPGASPVNVNNLNSARNVTFCIAPIDPWFQTTTGDVRFLNLSNPVPSGLFASTDPTYPGIFYSSGSAADFGNSGAQASSQRQWVINNEYSYNSNTRNRNGGMSYDFYKNKALQDGVNVEELTPGVLNQSEITGNGVYEANGNLTINSYTHVSGRRVVILVNGNVTINSNISVPVGQGLLIVAAKQNITIATGVGAPTTNSTATNLDGIYTAQGSVIIPSVDNGCQTLVPDRRLNVGGALIANSLKPFATSGNSIQNNRSLCVDNLLYPALYVVQRPDFLIQLTDFYKTSYTKWREVNP